MGRKNSFLAATLYVLVICVVYKQLLHLIPLSGGDYFFLSPNLLSYWRQYAFFAWDPTVQLGTNMLPLMHYAPIAVCIGLVGFIFQNNAIITERLVWWIPFFIVSFLSVRALLKELVPDSNGLVAPIIFIANTYILMVLGGGQVAGISLAYALSPLLFAIAIKLSRSIAKKTDYREVVPKMCQLSFIIGAEMVFDYRIAYVLLVGYGLYWCSIGLNYVLLQKIQRKDILLQVSSFLVLPVACGLLLNAFWLLPSVFNHGGALEQLGNAYTTKEAVQYFSFTKFENAFGILHPNWPENIFGKTYFFNPFFLFIPLIAYGGLFLRKSDNEKRMFAFFACMGLVAVFLGKGANDPFGFVYLWLFNHVPGFVLFRDSTKWFVLIIIAYCVLIEASLLSIQSWLEKKHSKKNAHLIVSSCFLIVFLCLISPAFSGKLTGTFLTAKQPVSVHALNTYLCQNKTYSRILWLPSYQFSGCYSLTHPKVDATVLLASSSEEILKKLSDPNTELTIENAAIRRIVVPDDFRHEIFIKNRKYSENLYLQTLRALRGLPWLREEKQFGRNVVFTVRSPKQHSWLTDGGEIQETRLSPVQYQIHLRSATIPTNLVFSEAYDPGWQLNSNGKVVHSVPYGHIMQFPVSDTFQEIFIYYQPQRLVWIGLVVSVVTAGLLLIMNGRGMRKR